jgi:hypothetical protein
MNQNTQIPNRELALPITKQLCIAVGYIMGVTKTKQLTFMEIYL